MRPGGHTRGPGAPGGTSVRGATTRYMTPEDVRGKGRGKSVAGEEVTCDVGAGEIVAWNVNSVRARLEQAGGLAEERSTGRAVPAGAEVRGRRVPVEAVRAAGYHAAAGQKTYNGVAILASGAHGRGARPRRTGWTTRTARLIAATVNGVRVISVYAPNGQEVDSEAYQYKLQWYGRLRRYLDARHEPGEPLVLCGDWNVAPEDRDVRPGAVGGADALHEDGAGRAEGAVRVRPDGHFRQAVPERAEVQLVGLPDAGVPEEPGAAHRPHVRDGADRGAAAGRRA